MLSGRLHIVLVPGFAGFDALGQLEYYAGITPLFQRWKKLRGRDDRDLAIHYFDNLPTAGVVTRAARLRSYLVKRIARGEFVRGDGIVLVGHSTGGLDIRRLLWELNKAPSQTYPVDGATAKGPFVRGSDVLRLIHKVVFLSVPQWGTNIADWVRSHKFGRELVVADLRVSFTASQVPLLESLQQAIVNCASKSTDIGVVGAIRDALAEAEADTSNDATQIANAQEANSELQLWLRHIATDFHAIDDLASQSPTADSERPAHFNAERRKEETAFWGAAGMETRSYATVGARPFRFAAGEPAPLWDLLNPLTYPELTARQRPSPKTDVVYDYAYRACAGGPFVHPNPHDLPAPRAFVVNAKTPDELELWDNDGIVNTASMLWPDGNETRLVTADHMDIVGHFKPVREASKDSLRKFQAYDLLASDSGFEEVTFEKVWNEIFDFCVAGGRSSVRRQRRIPRHRTRQKVMVE